MFDETTPLNTPLGDPEYDRLDSILNRFKNENAMNLEAVDGFFAALISSPQMTPPSVYLQEVWGGGEMSDKEAFGDGQEFKEFMNLIMRHWNDVSRRLHDSEVFFPVLIQDSDGNAEANDWANGFVRGMKLHYEDWAELIEDEKNSGALVPILTLAHEHDPDPELRPYKEPITKERREQLIDGLAAGTMRIYEYFESHRRMAVSAIKEGNTYRRKTPKVGRNESCPCGSGRKYKRCCGNVTLN